MNRDPRFALSRELEAKQTLLDRGSRKGFNLHPGSRPVFKNACSCEGGSRASATASPREGCCRPIAESRLTILDDGS
jgi:hypothetical protein